MPGGDGEDLLEMHDRIAAVLTPYQPALGAATAQQGAEVVSINQNAALHRQIDHLIRSGDGIEDLGELRVVVHLRADVVQRIQQWRRSGVRHDRQTRKGH